MIPQHLKWFSGRRRKPRASGDDPCQPCRLTRKMLVNPARAGMIPRRARRIAWPVGKPRASGDDPAREAQERQDAK